MKGGVEGGKFGRRKRENKGGGGESKWRSEGELELHQILDSNHQVWKLRTSKVGLFYSPPLYNFIFFTILVHGAFMATFEVVEILLEFEVEYV